jgi:hypothetical protein
MGPRGFWEVKVMGVPWFHITILDSYVPVFSVRHGTAGQVTSHVAV